MKKNTILAVVIIILLILVGWFGYNYGVKSGTKDALTRGIEQGRREGEEIGKSYSFSGKLEQKHKNDTVFMQCLKNLENECIDTFTRTKELIDPINLKECDGLLTDSAQENCRMIFVIKQVNQSGDKKECSVLKDENNKKGCELSALITQSVKTQNLKLCDNLSEIERKSCLSRVVERIIKMDPDKKWCNYLKDIDGPDEDSCLADVELLKKQQELPDPADTE